MEAQITAAWIGLLATVSATLLGIIPWRKWIARRRQQAQQSSVVDGLQRTRRTYAAVEDVAEAAGAQRVVLFAGHDNGGIPRPSSPFWVSALHWHSEPALEQGLQAVLDGYQRLKVDAAYISLLLAAEGAGVVVLHTNHMPESMLKQHYLAEGVVHAAVFSICIVENKFIFLSIARYTDQPFTAQELARAALKVNVIRVSMFPANGEGS